MWEGKIIVSIERVAAYIVESLVHCWWDALGDETASPVQRHTPFSWAALVYVEDSRAKTVALIPFYGEDPPD